MYLENLFLSDGRPTAGLVSVPTRDRQIETNGDGGRGADR